MKPQFTKPLEFHRRHPAVSFPARPPLAAKPHDIGSPGASDISVSVRAKLATMNPEVERRVLDVVRRKRF